MTSIGASNAAIDHLARWGRGGAAPPSAPGLTFTSSPKGGQVVARDEHGLALGGIRLAAVEAPTALNTGINGGAGFCLLYGTHVPFDEATLAALYPSHKEYVDQVRTVSFRNAAKGYIVAADALATARAASQSDIP